MTDREVLMLALGSLIVSRDSGETLDFQVIVKMIEDHLNGDKKQPHPDLIRFEDAHVKEL